MNFKATFLNSIEDLLASFAFQSNILLLENYHHVLVFYDHMLSTLSRFLPIETSSPLAIKYRDSLGNQTKSWHVQKMQELILSKLDSPTSQLRLLVKLNRKVQKLKIHKVLSPKVIYDKKLETFNILYKRLKFKEGHNDSDFSLI